MRSVESCLSIHCSFGDHNMQVSTLGRAAGAGVGIPLARGSELLAISIL